MATSAGEGEWCAYGGALYAHSTLVTAQQRPTQSARSTAYVQSHWQNWKNVLDVQPLVLGIG